MSLLTTNHDPSAPILTPTPTTHSSEHFTTYTTETHLPSSPSSQSQSLSPRSPNAIPPRTSSTGLNSSNHTPSKSVLRPVAEADWIGSGRKRSQSGSPGSPPSLVMNESRFSFAPLDDVTNLNIDGTREPGTSGFDQEKDSTDVEGSDLTRKDGGASEPSIQKEQLNYAQEKPNVESLESSSHCSVSQVPTLESQHVTTIPVWSPTKEEILLGPYTYLSTHPGKDIRTRLISAFNAHLRVPPTSLATITRVIGMLHTASLLVDDVEDSSLLRRGIPVAHSIFGTAQTINSANYVYFLALSEVMKLTGGAKGMHAVEIYTEELLNLHRGQGMDLYWRERGICPSEEDYLEMVGNKTGGLFRLAVKLMQAESECTKDFIPLTALISTLFQIRDDYSNLLSPSYTLHKGLAEDLTEGKFSFPIIHAISTGSRSHSQELAHILRQKTENVEVKKYAVGLMEATGSFQYCRQVLGRLKAEAKDVCTQLEMGVGDDVLAILDMLDVGI